MQFELFENKPEIISPDAETFSLEEVFEAYNACRKNKRNKSSSLAFEVDLETNLIQLWRELNAGSWTPGPSSVFIVEKPVKREVFAASFRDRVVHHIIVRRLNPLFEKTFIYDSYACRVGKGTHFGISRVERFIRQCSGNYTKDCWVLKLDIKGFFMHVQRRRLAGMLYSFLNERYTRPDRAAVFKLCRMLVLSDPTTDCVVKSSARQWDGLPPDKSLFGVPPDCGLPIGNLTSQVFANFYLNGLDHFCKHDLRLRYYGRYVDDMIIIHRDRQFLSELVPVIRCFLSERLGLALHPRKIKLQHYSKGVPFLGVFIKPGCTYPGTRIRKNFRQAIERQNEVVRTQKPDKQETRNFLSSINSYLGILRHCASWRFRTKTLRERLSPWWKKRFELPRRAEKLSVSSSCLRCRMKNS